MKQSGVKFTGTPSQEELMRSSGYICGDDLYAGPIAVIECVEKIPCNPCEAACPRHAISIGSDITELPVLDSTACTGCGLCIALCPGLAIYVKNYRFEEHRASILFPFEYLPLPQKGQSVEMVDRFGEVVCTGELLLVQNLKRNEQTTLIKAAYDKKFFLEVVSMKRLPRQTG